MELSPLVHPSVRTKLCGCQNSATTGLIHSKSSSMEPSYPVDVQRQGHFCLGPWNLVHRAGDPPELIHGTFPVKLPSGECHRTSLMISQHWFRYWLSTVRQQAIHYLSQCWLRSLSPYGVTRPQWVNNVSIGSGVSPVKCFTSVSQAL